MSFIRAMNQKSPIIHRTNPTTQDKTTVIDMGPWLTIDVKGDPYRTQNMKRVFRTFYQEGKWDWDWIAVL